MHLENLVATLEIWALDRDLPVEAARAQKGRVEDVRPVGGGDQDHAGVDVETVHLDQHLVERLFALVMAAAETRAAMPTDGIDFVNENDGGRVVFRLFKEVAHAAGANADEHLHKVRAGDGVEGHAGFSRYGPGQQRLSSAGRAVEQHALGDLGPQRLEPRGLGEELLDFL